MLPTSACFSLSALLLSLTASLRFCDCPRPCHVCRSASKHEDGLCCICAATRPYWDGICFGSRAKCHRRLATRTSDLLWRLPAIPSELPRQVTVGLLGAALAPCLNKWLRPRSQLICCRAPCRGPPPEYGYGTPLYGSCGYLSQAGTQGVNFSNIPFPIEMLSAVANINLDYPGSCGRCSLHLHW